MMDQQRAQLQQRLNQINQQIKQMEHENSQLSRTVIHRSTDKKNLDQEHTLERINMLYQIGKQKQQRRQTSSQELKIRQQEEELKRFSFVPQINQHDHIGLNYKGIVEKTQDYMAMQKLKLEENKEIKMCREMDECTFRPQLNHSSVQKCNRNADSLKKGAVGLYERDMEFLREKEKKLESIFDKIYRSNQIGDKEKDISNIYEKQQKLNNRLASPKRVAEKSREKKIEIEINPRTINRTQQKLDIISDDQLDIEKNAFLGMLDQLKNMMIYDQEIQANNRRQLELELQKQKQYQQVKWVELDTKCTVNDGNITATKVGVDQIKLRTLNDLQETSQFVLKKGKKSKQQLQQSIDFSNDLKVGLTDLNNTKYQFMKTGKKINLENNNYSLDVTQKYISAGDRVQTNPEYQRWMQRNMKDYNTNKKTMNSSQLLSNRRIHYSQNQLGSVNDSKPNQKQNLKYKGQLYRSKHNKLDQKLNSSMQIDFSGVYKQRKNDQKKQQNHQSIIQKSRQLSNQFQMRNMD